MDYKLQRRLLRALKLYAASAALIHIAAFLPTFLLMRFSQLSASLFLGLLLCATSHALTFLSFVCVARPDNQPTASAVGFTLIPAPQPADGQQNVTPVGQFPAYTSASFSPLALAPPSTVPLGPIGPLTRIRDALVVCLRSIGFIFIFGTGAGLGVSGELLLWSASTRLAPVTWGQLTALGFCGSLYASSLLLRQRHILKFPLLQRSAVRQLKLALPGALSDALAALLLFFLGGPSSARTAAALCAALHVACSEMGRSALQVALTERSPTPPSAQQSLRRLLTASALSPVHHQEALLPTASASPIHRFKIHEHALALCELAESPAPEASQERGDLFSSQESYVRTIRIVLSRLDLLTLRIRDRLGCPKAGGAAGELVAAFPGFFQEASDGSVGIRAEKGERWPATTTFFDLKLCEWSARAGAAFTVASRDEDVEGTAQLSGCNAAALSSLLSCLLACEELAVAWEDPSQPATWQDTLVGKAAASAGIAGFLPPETSGTARLAVPVDSSSPTPRPLLQKGVRTASEGFGRGALCRDAAVLVDVLKVSVCGIGRAFGKELVGECEHKGNGTNLTWFPRGAPTLYGAAEDHMEKLKDLMDS